jgi:hypothetical protein
MKKALVSDASLQMQGAASTALPVVQSKNGQKGESKSGTLQKTAIQ